MASVPVADRRAQFEDTRTVYTEARSSEKPEVGRKGYLPAAFLGAQEGKRTADATASLFLKGTDNAGSPERVREVSELSSDDELSCKNCCKKVAGFFSRRFSENKED